MSRRESNRDAGSETGSKSGSPELVVLGQIAGSHALRGEVRVRWLGDGPENLARASEVWLAEPAAAPGGAPTESDAERFEVLRCGSGRAGEVRLALRGVGDRDAADALRGRMVLGDAAALAPLEEGEFYWHELVGCEVVDQEGNVLGEVLELWETGAHDLLVVRGTGGERHLLSTARELMPEVDVKARRVVVVGLPGLLDAPISERRER